MPAVLESYCIMLSKTSIYLETSIPSYLTSCPSRDLIVAAHQQLTHDWWTESRSNHEIVVSEVILQEIRRGRPDMAQRRLALVEPFPVLALNNEVRALARLYGSKLGLAPSASVDILHIAFAVVYRIDYLLTWNCKHIANGHVIRRLHAINRSRNDFIPVILTPEELIDKPGDRHEQ